MKNVKKASAVLSTILLVFLIGIQTLSAQKKSEIKEVVIKTSVNCDMCKETIEKALAFEKGIKKSNVDVTANTVTVSYDPDKISVEQIKKAISKAGYDADEVPADPKAVKKLDDCCKKGKVCNDKK